MSIQVLPVEGLPEVRPGDDLTSLLAGPLGTIGLGDGDVVAVTQKIVSKAEGRVVREEERGRDAWIEHETRRVVARRGDLVIAETRHGFVCANAGVTPVTPITIGMASTVANLMCAPLRTQLYGQLPKFL